MANYITVKLHQLSLNPDNPRFDPVKDEITALEELCERENMVEVAEDIVAHGLNPLELIGIVSTSGRGGKTGATYVVHEGNRRVGALKMVTDPRLAPSKYQLGFRKLDAKALPTDIPAVEFASKADLDHWIALLHQRDSNPAGRKSWNPDQQARAFGTTRNKRVVELLDYAEAQGWISRKDRRGKVSTLQRFVSNPAFRRHAGFNYPPNTDDLKILDQTTFDHEMKALIDDILAGNVNTRFDSNAIQKWVAARTTPRGAANVTGGEPASGVGGAGAAFGGAGSGGAASGGAGSGGAASGGAGSGGAASGGAGSGGAASGGAGSGGAASGGAGSGGAASGGAGSGGAATGGAGSGGAASGSGQPSPSPAPTAKPPSAHKKLVRLPYNPDISTELQALSSQKLSAFYYAICDVPLEHTPLLAVGCWSFLESLCALHQGTPSKGFKDVLSHNFLDHQLGFTDKTRRTELVSAIARLYHDGNVTKHAMSGAWMDGQQLYNDMATLAPVIIRLIQTVNGRHAPGTLWP